MDLLSPIYYVAVTRQAAIVLPEVWFITEQGDRHACHLLRNRQEALYRHWNR